MQITFVVKIDEPNNCYVVELDARGSGNFKRASAEMLRPALPQAASALAEEDAWAAIDSADVEA